MRPRGKHAFLIESSWDEGKKSPGKIVSQNESSQPQMIEYHIRYPSVPKWKASDRGSEFTSDAARSATR